MTESKLREALQLILPMAKSYAAEHPIGSNAEYVRIAEETLSLQPTSYEGTPPIKRYDLTDIIAGGEPWREMLEGPLGDWMRFEDHERILRELAEVKQDLDDARCGWEAAVEEVRNLDDQLATLHARERELADALREIAWSNDSKWQSDRARKALATLQSVSAAPQDVGISVQTGNDGTWVCFKTRSGKSFCFQPIQLWGPKDPFRSCVEEWCRDQQEAACRK